MSPAAVGHQGLWLGLHLLLSAWPLAVKDLRLEKVRLSHAILGSSSTPGPQGQEDEAQGAHYLFLILGDVWAPCGLVSVSRNAIHGSEKLRPAHTQAKRMTPPALTSLKTKKPVPEVILFYNGLEASRPRFILPAHVARARARGRL